MLLETETFLPPCFQTFYYVYIESTGFCLLILYPAFCLLILLNPFCLGILFIIDPLGFQDILSHNLYTEIAFLLPFPS